MRSKMTIPSQAWKVILVEDSFDDSQVTSAVLEHFGVEVTIAKNGNECLTLLPQLEPTLVITDLAMPHRDGWQTLAAIRADEQYAHLTVVALTAYHSAEIAESARLAGFDGCFPKPVSPQTFIKELQAILAG